MGNPGVTVIGVIQNEWPTPAGADWDENILDIIKRKEYAQPKYKLKHGDGVVDVNSAIYPLLKWAYEFDKKVPNAKPIKIVQRCGSYNEKYFIYDNHSGERESLQNEYFGISCECVDDPKQSCFHGDMNHDKYLFRLMADVHKTY